MYKKICTVLCLAAVTLTTACGQKATTPSPTPDAPAATPTPAATATAPADAKPKVPAEPIVLPQLSAPKSGEDIAVMETSLGTIKLRFFPEYAPKSVENFVTHAKDGYYDNVTFHRVIKDFVIQSGDPTGTGSGGESIWKGVFEAEITPSLHHIRGALAMAHTPDSVDTNGSQFYIVQNDKVAEEAKAELERILEQQDEPIGKDENDNEILMSMLFPTEIAQKYLEVGGSPELDYGYTVFGQVIEGMDIVDKIAAVDVGDNNKPNEDIVIKSIKFEQYK